jgi:hypothetical protein
MSNEDRELQSVLDHLAELGPGPGEAPLPPGQALARIRARLEKERATPITGRYPLMIRRKPIFALGLLVVLFGLALSFPAVRAAASDFLGIFRVQKFSPIFVSEQQVQLLMEIADGGLFPGEIEMIDEPGDPVEAASLEAAEAEAGFNIRLPSELGAPAHIYTVDGGQGRLTINLEDARRLLAAAGGDPALLSDSLQGQVVDVTVYNGVSVDWADGTTLMQTSSPLIDYPDDVDTVAIGEAILQALGVEPSQARHLAETIDWTNTLLFPVPENIATFTEAQVDGVTGLGLSSLDNQHAVILWEKDGRLYVITGDQAVAELADIADSLN